MRYSILLFPWSYRDRSPLVNSSYVVSFFCFFEVEETVVFLTDKGNVFQLLDNSNYVVSSFCLIEVEEVVVSLTDRGNVL